MWRWRVKILALLLHLLVNTLVDAYNPLRLKTNEFPPVVSPAVAACAPGGLFLSIQLLWFHQSAYYDRPP